MNILKGKAWKEYYFKHESKVSDYMKSYAFTHHYEQCHKVGDYYYCFSILKGFLNKSELKRQISLYIN